MNAREMHYDFKQKLNKIDSQKNRNLIVPEIDWKLNEAQEVFVKMIAQPRLASQLGFEMNQRTIDDIRTIVINQTPQQSNCITLTPYDNSSFIGTLPANYWFFVSGRAYATKGSCVGKKLAVREIQHEDEQDLSPFDKADFEWRISNMRFFGDKIRMFTDGSFTLTQMCMDYIKQPRRIHNAQDYKGGTYVTLDGATLTGSQSCELPPMTHKEIVDIAVLITAGDLSLPDYNFKQNKVQLVK